MITRNFDIVLRIPEQSHIPQLFQIVQNDVDVYILTVKITDGVNEIDYSEVSSATITFVKSDGNVVQGNMTVGADALTYTMGTNEIACPGYVLTSVQLIGSSNERLTTARFRFEVIPDLLKPSAIRSTTEYAELQRLKAELEGIDVVDLANDLTAHMAENTAKHIKETGSNANGRYIKFDDGTLICYARQQYACTSIATENGWYRATISEGGATTKPFPSAFIGTPRVILSRTYDGGPGLYTTLMTLSSANNCIVSPLHTAAFTDTIIAFDYIAIGRWKV